MMLCRVMHSLYLWDPGDPIKGSEVVYVFAFTFGEFPQTGYCYVYYRILPSLNIIVSLIRFLHYNTCAAKNVPLYIQLYTRVASVTSHQAGGFGSLVMSSLYNIDSVACAVTICQLFAKPAQIATDMSFLGSTLYVHFDCEYHIEPSSYLYT